MTSPQNAVAAQPANDSTGPDEDQEQAATATLNEDWLRTLSWNVRYPNGALVDDLDGLAIVLGITRDDAAVAVLDKPMGKAAPAGIVEEAKAVRAGSAPGGEPGEQVLLAGGSRKADEVEVVGRPEGNSPIPGAPVPGQSVEHSVEGKAKGGGNPFTKQPIKKGSWVQVGDDKGQVDQVVTSGKVPGVESDVEGTKDKPALRIMVWEKDGDKYKSSGRRIAAAESRVKRIPPLNFNFGKKTLAALTDVAPAVAGLVAEHTTEVIALGVEPQPLPSPVAVKTVYERGLAGWPGGSVTRLDAKGWALGRVRAFLDTAAGQRPQGYAADDDLLPEEVKRAGQPKTCRYCDGDATKGLLWAEGMARIAVCDEHEEKARRRIEEQGDDVVGEEEYGVKGAAVDVMPPAIAAAGLLAFLDGLDEEEDVD